METININDTATQMVWKINENFNNIGGVPSANVQRVFLGGFVQDGTSVKQSCIVKPVDYGITYKFALPEGITAIVAYGTSTNSLTSASSAISNGDTFTFPATACAQRISFSRTGGSLTVAEVEEMVANGSIAITFDDLDVIAHNTDKEAMLWSLAKMTYRQFPNSDSAYYYKKAPLIAHIGDLHGDAQRAYNFFKFCKQHGIDECIVTGDAVLEDGADGSGFVYDAAKATGMHVIFTIGNHETQEVTQSAGANFSNHIGTDNATEYGYYKSDGTITDRGYYYHDIAAKKIRIIVLDQYDGGVYGGGATTPSNGNMPKTQLEWFIATLKSTPAGYGVIVSMHSPESNIVNDGNKFFTAVPLSGNDGDCYSYADNGFYSDAKRPISQIVDAFISRSSLTDSFTVKVGGSLTGSITADFTSGVAEGVEFIGYVNGHRHQDRIGFLKKDISGAALQNNQLCMNITSGFGIAGAPDDIPRSGTGVIQDAFNVFAVDRTTKKVRVVRIGSNVKQDLTMRDYMVISYSPSNNS